MTHDLPSLAGADWLNAPAAQRVFDVLMAEGDEVRIVGGAVRNALLGRTMDGAILDFATTALPEAVLRQAAAAGIKAVPTGIEHGTVTLVVDGRAFEVTTLRSDVETDGRHAVVRFGRDWQADAERRDFTMNALFVDRTGAIHDPVGGYPDLLARRVRFIGDPDRRIAEDRLRVLRFFRFLAEYGEGEPDRAGMAAVIRAHDDIRALSRERIAQEMRKLVVAPNAPAVLVLMQDTGVLPVALAGVGYVGVFARVAGVEQAAKAAPAVATRLAALGCRIIEDVERLTERLRLSNAERDRMLATLSAASDFTPFPDAIRARQLLYRHGSEAFRDGVLHGFAWSTAPPPAKWRELFHLPEQWVAPVFPLSGKDVTDLGVPRGPLVGKLLKELENWWVDHDFAATESELRARLRQIAASQQ